MFAPEITFRTNQSALRDHVHVTTFHVDFCPERFQAFQVKIHRAITDDAATGQ